MALNMMILIINTVVYDDKLVKNLILEFVLMG